MIKNKVNREKHQQKRRKKAEAKHRAWRKNIRLCEAGIKGYYLPKKNATRLYGTIQPKQAPKPTFLDRVLGRSLTPKGAGA